MTAVFLSVLIVGGAIAYVGWAARCVAQGAAAWWFVAGAPIAYLALPLFLTMLWFAVAWIWRTPRNLEAQLGFAGSARLYVGELMAVAASWPLMALHRVLIRDPAPAPATLPAVLVHGVLTNDGVWFMLRRHLARRGIGPVYTVNYGPPHADIERFAGQLAAKIDAVCAATGAARVVLVGHSMGGLVARAYLRHFGGERVARLVTLGAPHHGSVLAWTFFGTCLAQMRPGNVWLAALNEGEAEPAPVPIASIWSRHDSMVVPQVSAVLGCAQNIALTGLGHNALLDDPAVHRLIAGLLAGENASPGAPF